MQAKRRYYIGTYTGPIKFGTGQILQGKGEGIYLLELDLESGTLAQADVFAGIDNPSYLALNEAGSHLYAVNELKEFRGEPSGSVSAFHIEGENGELTFLNKQATKGTDPCHVAVDPAGARVYAANFMSGSVSAFPIQADGSLAACAQFIQHAGSSADPNRQAGPHAHATVFSPDGRFAFIPDLGLDKLMIYRVDQKTHDLMENDPPYFQTIPGAGPRHCVFSADGKFCYLINELDSTILVLAYDQESGSFTELQNVPSLPEDVVVPANTCADVHLTPAGRFLYGSNRGHNSLIFYRVDQGTGLLTYVGCVPCGGAIPRNFAIDPRGDYLLCANQDSDNIVVFRIDQQAGYLEQVSEIAVPTPVCVIPASE